MFHHLKKAITIEMIGIVSFLGMYAAWSLFSGSEEIVFAETPAASTEAAEPFDYGDYAQALKQVDDQGLVNYAALKNDPVCLHDYMQAIAELPQAIYEGWSENDRAAFWINAYNGLTLKAIIDHYPIKATALGKLKHPENSIRQIPGVWKTLKFKVLGKQLTLDAIEHKILRPQFKMPEVHMALVCAAMSCPPLRNEPFIGEKLEEQFLDQAKKFLADEKRFKIDQKKNIVYLSEIFNWFGGDFEEKFLPKSGFGNHGKKEKASLNYIAGHLDESRTNYLKNGKYKIKSLDYDWTLNEKASE